MVARKSPGPNGFTTDFFYTRWNIIGKEIWEVVEKYHTFSTILQDFNETFITLIPKEHEENK
jgi:hypothetical protein